MADGKQWFKVWTSILTDPNMADCHNDIIGAWVRLGALVAQHGEHGALKISRKQLQRQLHFFVENDAQFSAMIVALQRLNVTINEEQKSDNGVLTVSFSRWHKYQVDSTAYERVKKHRKAQNDNAQEEKRREEKRRDKKRVFKEPTVDEIKAYCLERKNNVNPEKWLAHYQAKDWFIGKNKMKDWKAAVRTWETDTVSATQEADRDKLKRDLKQAYQDRQTAQGFLDSCEPEDKRYPELKQRITLLTRKIETLEGKINV